MEELKRDLLKDMEYYTFDNKLNLYDLEGNFGATVNTTIKYECLSFIKKEAESRGIEVTYYDYDLDVDLLHTL